MRKCAKVSPPEQKRDTVAGGGKACRFCRTDPARGQKPTQDPAQQLRTDGANRSETHHREPGLRTAGIAARQIDRDSPTGGRSGRSEHPGNAAGVRRGMTATGPEVATADPSTQAMPQQRQARGDGHRMLVATADPSTQAMPPTQTAHACETALSASASVRRLASHRKAAATTDPSSRVGASAAVAAAPGLRSHIDTERVRPLVSTSAARRSCSARAKLG